MKGNSPGCAGVPPTINATPLKSHFVVSKLAGVASATNGSIDTSPVIGLLYSTHSETQID